jgi:hypothetical protein
MKPDRSAIKTEVTKAERVAAAGKGWLAETPISIRGAAVNELWKNLGSALAGRKARQKKSKKKERKERPVSLKWKRKCGWERESVTIETTKMDFQAGPRSHVTIFGDPVCYSDSREVTDFLEGLAKRSERLPKNKSHTGPDTITTRIVACCWTAGITAGGCWCRMTPASWSFREPQGQGKGDNWRRPLDKTLLNPIQNGWRWTQGCG